MKQFLAFLTVLFITTRLLAQVNLQTGSAIYNIPLFQYSDSKGLATSVSIAYSSGQGFKPGELAGDIGQGWAMLAGGCIQRVVMGEPDDQDSRLQFPVTNPNGTPASFTNDNSYDIADSEGGNYIINYYPNGYLYSEYTNIEGTPLSASTMPHELQFNPRSKGNGRTPWKMSRRALADREQDRFVFSFNGRGGEFLIGKTGSGPHQVLLSNTSKLKIDYDDSQNLSSLGIRNRIQSFTITDENGIVYKFQAYAKSRIMEYGEETGAYAVGAGYFPQTHTMYACPNSTSSSPTAYNFTYCPSNCPQPSCPTVYKTIPIPTTGAGARLNPYIINKWYLTEIYNPLTQQTIFFSYTQKWQDNTISRTVNGISTDVTYVEQREVVENKLLSSITFPDETSIQFTYETISRIDYKGNEPVSIITQKYRGTAVSSYTLSYGYMFRTFQTPVPYNTGPALIGAYPGNSRLTRLYLIALQHKAGVLAEPPYQFRYHAGDDHQEYKFPQSFSLNTDCWGFYNATFDYDTIYRRPDFNGHQTYSQGGLDLAKLGLLSGISLPTGGSVHYQYENIVAKDKSGVERPYGGVRVSTFTTTSGIYGSTANVTSYKYVLSDGTSSGWGYEPVKVIENKTTVSYMDAQGHYKYSWKPASQMAVSVINTVISTAVSIIQQSLTTTALGLFKAAGGSTAGTASRAIDASRVSNGFFVKNLGTFLTLAQYFYSFLFNSDLGTDIAIWLGFTNDSEETKNYIEFSYNSIYERNQIGIHFSRVEVKDETISAEKTIYELDRPASGWPEILDYSNNPVSRYPANYFDNLIRVSSVDENGILVKQVENTYYKTSSFYNQTAFRSCHPEVVQSYAAPFNTTNYLNHLSGQVYHYYYPRVGNTLLTQTMERSFLNGVLTDTKTTDNSYDPTTLLLRETITTNAKGERIGSKKYYAGDFPGNTVLQKLSGTYNAYNAEVSEATWMEKTPGSGRVLVGVAHKEFTELPNGDIKVTKQYTSELLAPIASTLASNPANPNNPTAENFVKEQGTVSFNASGDPTDITSPTGKVSSMLYDYNGRYVVAQIVNSAAANCAYTSFEGTNHNNFTINMAGVIEEKGVTGSKCYDVYNGISFSFTAQSKKKYLSFWWQGQAPAISFSAGNPALKEQTALPSGWTFYLYELPANITSLSIASSTQGSSLVDEVRCYPVTARMVTTTYNLPYGKSAVCDASNRLAYFEYDAFGRIIKELNENRNVIKTYEYKFKTL